VILHYFHSQERLQLLKNEGHILCHTKVTLEETRVVIPTLHIHIDKGE
jgi:hypothetical protein